MSGLHDDLLDDKHDADPTGPALGPGRAGPPEIEVEVEQALIESHRRDWAAVVAATVRTARDLDLAEECVQEAYATAVLVWQRDGIPTNPAAWLTTTARRRAIDAIRREHTFRSKLPLLIEPDTKPGIESGIDQTAVEDTAIGNAMTDNSAIGTDESRPGGPAMGDDRLRLIFLCCHPALPADGQVALTLRLVCGVTTPDVAKTFLVSEATMAARITRAKKKIVSSRIPFRMPKGAELPDRLNSVLTALYLMFTTGHTAPTGPDLVRTEVLDAAVQLGRALHQLMPDETEVAGLLALMLVTDARRTTRTSDSGRLLQLADQDRSRWNRTQLAEGDTLIVEALRRAQGRPGPYTLQAAIAALYAEPADYADTDWAQILYLYDQLLRSWPSPVVGLNRIVSLSHVVGPETALAQLEHLDQDRCLATYPYLPAVKADLLERLGRSEEAAQHYRNALDLTDNQAEQAFLTDKIQTLTRHHRTCLD